MPKLSDLKAAKESAKDAYDEYKDAVDESVRLAVDAIRAEHGKRMSSLAVAYSEAAAAYTAERNRIALAQAKTPFPVGTKLFEWRRYHRYGSVDDPYKTGRVGVVEIWSPESVRPANMNRYSEPSVGRFVVRLLKADGSPSLKYSDRNTDDWYPEGKKPKAGK